MGIRISGYKQIAALSIIVVFGIVLLYSLSSFLNAFLSAVILYMILKPAMLFLMNTWKWKKGWANLVLLLLSFLTILLPFWGLYQLLYAKIYDAVTHVSGLTATLNQFDDIIFKRTGIKLLSGDFISKIQDTLSKIVPDLLGKTAGALTDMAMMYFILYFLLDNIGKNEKLLIRIIPLNDEKRARFSNELESMVYSNLIGAPLIAIMQGIAAGICYWFCSLPDPWFWAVITGFLSFLPLVGTPLIWIPASIYMLAEGYTWQGIVILIYGVLIITNIDNVFRLIIQKKFADVHPVITVLGVIVGFNWFGLAGVIFGPLLLSYFVIMVKMYWEEYGDKMEENV